MQWWSEQIMKDVFQVLLAWQHISKHIKYVTDKQQSSQTKYQNCSCNTLICKKTFSPQKPVYSEHFLVWSFCFLFHINHLSQNSPSFVFAVICWLMFKWCSANLCHLFFKSHMNIAKAIKKKAKQNDVVDWNKQFWSSPFRYAHQRNKRDHPPNRLRFPWWSWRHIQKQLSQPLYFK